jgi:hypothetical protein
VGLGGREKKEREKKKDRGRAEESDIALFYCSFFCSYSKL